MAIYVDDMKAKYGKMIMSHMMADTTEELLEMADIIGVSRKWIQYPNTRKEHFDICLQAKKVALKNGAKEITTKEMVKFMKNKELKNKIEEKKHGC